MTDALLDLKIVRSGRIYQGLPMAVIRQWMDEGRLLPDDLVRPVGAANWMTISVSPELCPPPVVAGSKTTSEVPLGSHILNTPPTPAPKAPGSSARPANLTPRTPSQTPRPSTPTPRANRPAPVPSSRIAAMTDDLGIVAPARYRRRRHLQLPEDTELDMTPMIDVTFQLLIFFMLSNQLANPAPIEVPVAKYGKGVTPDGKQSILLDVEGRLYLGDHVDKDTQEPSLDTLISQVTQNSKDASTPLEVIISAHKGSQHKHVRELLERLHEVPQLGPIHLGVEEER